MTSHSLGTGPTQSTRYDALQISIETSRVHHIGHDRADLRFTTRCKSASNALRRVANHRHGPDTAMVFLFSPSGFFFGGFSQGTESPSPGDYGEYVSSYGINTT